MMESQELSELLERCLGTPDGERLSDADVRSLEELMSNMPHAVIFPLLLQRHGHGDTESLRQRVGILSADRRTLLFADHGEEWSRFYPEAEKSPSPETNDVIDTFLSTYGNCTAEENALLERMIFNPTPDYAEMLAREEQENLPTEQEAEAASEDPQQARINAFIREKHPSRQRPDYMPDATEREALSQGAKAPVQHPTASDDSLLSESLAKLFIKRGRYERAYEIISGLNLKFPKKSAYFADQLRFLQKLIINRRELDRQQGGEAGASDSK
ncbi:MAG: hypothetical protein K2J38_01790 [Muribaculaceae bacterium]|nr:hypothetical protein [Muribaculaceae bacterium]